MEMRLLLVRALTRWGPLFDLPASPPEPEARPLDRLLLRLSVLWWTCSVGP